MRIIGDIIIFIMNAFGIIFCLVVGGWMVFFVTAFVIEAIKLTRGFASEMRQDSTSRKARKAEHEARRRTRHIAQLEQELFGEILSDIQDPVAPPRSFGV